MLESQLSVCCQDVTTSTFESSGSSLDVESRLPELQVPAISSLPMTYKFCPASLGLFPLPLGHDLRQALAFILQRDNLILNRGHGRQK